ncbi:MULTISPECIES: class I SAM-dependent methyltransferase [Shouchella]|uniref:class I SAM-dependent methyltransferase n=1 Tax=Shouchella TaxID=2893057 RepID=UPI002707E48D|nr:class I SAM-dependent methyltransferase [Shouchella clausii]MDO7268689.1 class I SAM-dependent methyltransferase [Shouchella clausii]MDO7289096.1 class I SAM-dependent methyltransferase [Shouchella clausii]
MSNYYGELCTKMYEKEKPVAEERELDFYLSFVKNKEMKVLEPMCGNGRLLIPFLQKGINIEGFDISEEMLKVCKEKGEKLHLDPFVFKKGIEEFKSDKLYDLILIPFGSFSLLPDSIVNKSLHNLKSVLANKGKLLLTLMEKEGEIKEILDWTETNRISFSNETIVEFKKVTYNEQNDILETQLKYQSIQNHSIRKSEIMDFPIKLYDMKAFKNTLKRNGFQNIIVHEIENGYGNGNSFKVVECS